MISAKIKELRILNKMTQKELAEKLYVTSQAVSRWENGEVEPSLSTIIEISKIFNVTTDELLNLESKKEEPQVVVEEKIVYAEAPKPVLALCDSCNKPIFEQSDLHRSNKDNKIICKKCYFEKKATDMALEKIKLQEKKEKGIKKRKKSIILGSIVASIVLLIMIIVAVNNSKLGIALIGLPLSMAAFTMISCFVLKNNPIIDVFEEICSWGVVTFPGLIWEFDLDGFMWLIGMKLLFWVLGLLIGLICSALACLVCALLSIIIYPFSIVKNIKHPEYYEEF